MYRCKFFGINHKTEITKQNRQNYYKKLEKKIKIGEKF